jgi:hypothetical protein
VREKEKTGYVASYDLAGMPFKLNILMFTLETVSMNGFGCHADAGVASLPIVPFPALTAAPLGTGVVLNRWIQLIRVIASASAANP